MIGNLIVVVLVLVVGLVIGILFARNNRKKLEATIALAKSLKK